MDPTATDTGKLVSDISDAFIDSTASVDNKRRNTEAANIHFVEVLAGQRISLTPEANSQGTSSGVHRYTNTANTNSEISSSQIAAEDTFNVDLPNPGGILYNPGSILTGYSMESMGNLSDAFSNRSTDGGTRLSFTPGTVDDFMGS